MPFVAGRQALHRDIMGKDGMVVSMTGFGTNQQEEEYTKMIQLLQMRFASNLSEFTNILVVNSVATEKYKIAKNFTRPIMCVKLQWLTQSAAKGQILQPEKYEIDKLFFGVEIQLLNINQQKLQKIKSLMQSEGGIVGVINNIREYCELQQAGKTIHVIVTQKQKTSKLRFEYYLLKHPLVCVDWLEDSLLRKMCKFPLDYAYNQEYLTYKQPAEHLDKMKCKLQDFLILSREQEGKVSTIFEDVLVYFHISVNKQLSDVLKKIIILNGGFYLENSSTVTHIVTQLIPQSQYRTLSECSLLVQIVRIQWLLDSIYLNKKLKQEDYYIRSFKTKFGQKANSRYQMQKSFQNSNSEKSQFYSCTLVRNFSSNSFKKSISLKVSDIKPQVKQKSKIKYGSSIFEGHSFYIESSHRNQSQIKSMNLEIMKNKGEVFSSRANIKSSLCFYLLADCQEYSKLVQKLTQIVKTKTKIIPVSYRWVKQCLSKTTFIDINKVQSYVYRPFAFKTPIRNFHKLVFEVIGLESVQKLRLKELYNALGSLKNMPNKSEVTHCLCGDYFNLIQKYTQLKAENPGVVFVKWGWLLQCANQGKIVETDAFLCEEDKKSQKIVEALIGQQNDQGLLKNNNEAIKTD